MLRLCVLMEGTLEPLLVVVVVVNLVVEKASDDCETRKLNSTQRIFSLLNILFFVDSSSFLPV